MEIQLLGASLNIWLDEMEQRITETGDLLDVMETEVEQLEVFWESGAGALWKQELKVRAEKVREYLTELWKIVVFIEAVGRELSDLENKMAAEAESL